MTDSSDSFRLRKVVTTAFARDVKDAQDASLVEGDEDTSFQDRNNFGALNAATVHNLIERTEKRRNPVAARLHAIYEELRLRIQPLFQPKPRRGYVYRPPVIAVNFDSTK